MLEQFYKECRNELIGRCTVLTRDPILAEDLVHEAFLRAMEQYLAILESLSHGQKKAWFYRVIKNMYIDRLRHQRFEAVSEELPGQGNNDPEYDGIDWEQLLGTLLVPENLAEDFYQFDVECSSVKVVKEEKRHILENSPRIILGKDILTASPQGVLVRNSAVLTIEENITPQDILDHVEIVNCARVDCTEKQKAAVYQKSTNVPQIGGREENGEPSGMLGILLNLAETKMINADKYVL